MWVQTSDILGTRQGVGTFILYYMFLGYFYAPDAPDESVLGMCTNANNSLLVTGDTQGFIKVWDIMTHCVRPAEDGVRKIIYYMMLLFSVDNV